MSLRSALRRAGDVATVEAGGVELAVGRAGAEKMRWRAESEAASLARFVETVGPTSVVWDVGAALGLHACVAARLGATVVAVEPHPTVIPRLAANLRRNEGEAATVVGVALSDRAGTLALSHGADVAVSEGQIEAVEGAGELLVSSARGDDLVRDGLPAPDVVKLDVEGAEGRVVEGLRETLASGGVRAVFSEEHLAIGAGRRGSSGAYLDELASLGFGHEVVAERSGEERHVVSRWSR